MPALGKDLSKIRSHLGLTVQDVQHLTKIPVSTLKTIENGAIFSHPEENQTYIRSFVRSYGRALKIDDDVMIKALDQNQAGNYTHLLLEEYPALAPQEPTPSETEHDHEAETDSESENENEEFIPPEETIENEFSFEDEDQDSETAEEETIQAPQNIEDKSDVAETAPPKNETKPKTTDTEPSVKSVDWADVGRKFSQEKKHTPVWIVALIIILIIAGFVAYFLYVNGFFTLGDGSQQDQTQEQVDPANTATRSNLSLELEDSLAAVDGETEMIQSEQSAVPSGETLQLTIYAAYDGLGPVRVWSDIKPRMDPYWLEQGTAMQFEFSDTIRVRGSYENMLLFKDGNLIENSAQNFFQQESDYIELTRNFFESDEKWATSIDYELPEGIPPPDSIANRPTF
ncbi:helix-turn-helix domain-containing protein [Rhodohalobacter sp. 614A]|uniref:helix-turn-helix domain-containing protein n=1 Tax=Rhodohalobacter sp. 614A TaxID=2908649 RepID=UPI001F24628B|nr:helix-turn-helix domain-containing protein [Rhodohalobacter sp. 614A]